ncbi:MAG: hypothetical protein ACE5IO_00645 [Thermoplasmata archaeon]
MVFDPKGDHMYAIFKVLVEKKGKIDEILKDDLVSRQSIVVRDASALSMESKETFVLIEGSDEAIKKAEELFEEVGEKLEGSEAEEIYNKIKEKEDDAAGGMGLLFG